jgi:coatomer subunit beta'
MKSIKFEPTKKFKHYGEKVKQISFHSNKPLIMMAHYNGEVTIFNYNTQTLSKKLEISKKPLRTAIWAGEDWIVTAGDDLKIRIYNFHTTQKLYEFEGHKDFIRKVIFNSTFQYFLTCSDDKTIIKWTLQKDQFANVFSYEEHKHFVMDVKLQSLNEDTFASCSLDGTIKVWNINSKASNFTLKGHKAGINCIEFSKGNRPLLASGGDDFSIFIWDLSTRTMMTKIDNHEGNVVDLTFMTTMPFLISIAEDGKCNFYNTRNFEFCFDQNNFMQKGWSVSTKDNMIACGYDDGGIILQIGKNQSLASSGKGKLVWSKNNELYSSNLKAVITKNTRNLERIDFESKEMGTLEIYPHEILHNDNAQHFALVDESEYLIYKTQTFKQILFGKCKEFVWGPTNKFAILDQFNNVVILNTSGNTLATLKFDFYLEKIYGGTFLSIASSDFLVCYDWNGEKSIGRIDVEATNVVWDNNSLIVNSEKNIFVLEVNSEAEEEENVFTLKSEINDCFQNGFFISGLFFYTSASFKLNVVIRSKSFSLANIGFYAKPLEYLENHERLFLFDTNCQITSFKITQNLLKFLNLFSSEIDLNKVGLIETGLELNEDENDLAINILQSFDMLELAFKISKNIGRRIDFGIRLKLLDECLKLCEQLKDVVYWKKIGDLATTEGKLKIAEDCYWNCEDLNSLFLIASCTANHVLVSKIANLAFEKRNFSLAFNCYWFASNSEECLKVLITSQRFGEALVFAKTYCPSHIKDIYSIWSNHAINSKNVLLLKKIQKLKENESNSETSQQIEAVLKERNVKIASSKLSQFNSDFRKIEIHQTFVSEGRQGLLRKIDELVQNNQVKTEEAVDIPFESEGWEDPEIIQDME